MPNQPDITKRVLSIHVSRELYYQLKQEAEEHKLEFSAYVRMLLSEAMLDIELTPENKTIIKEEIANARTKRTNG